MTQLHAPVKQKRPANRWRVIWLITGALIVVLAALILIPVDWNRNQGERATEESEQDAIQQPIVETEESTATEAAKETETEETDSQVEAEHNFFIIAGSFKHLKNASDMQDKLKARGYPAEVMITENRLYRVSVSSYVTKEEANRALAGVKADPGLESCWLLSN